MEEVRGTGQKQVGQAGRSMAARLVMDSAAGLEGMGRLGKNQDIPLLLAKAVTELKRLDITPDMLMGFDTGDRRTNEKFHDIAVIYGGMEQKLECYMDSEDRMDIAAGLVGEAAFIKGSQ
jgi:ATP-dependent helicase/DNAse subunit B